MKGNIPPSPALVSVGPARKEASNPLVVIAELSRTWILLHEDRDTKRRRPPQFPDRRSGLEIGLEKKSELARHVASSSRREERTAPMHWLIGSSLPRDSRSSSDDGPVLVFHFSSLVCQLCSYSLAGLDENVAYIQSLMSFFEANAAIPQLLAQ